MANIKVGAHVGGENPIEDAKALGISQIQLFLGDPQSWKGTHIPGDLTAEEFAKKAENIDVFVHARYLINVATTNNKVRIPSRKLLQTDVDTAASIGAKAVIVHGGHVTADDDPSVGYENWAKALASNAMSSTTPSLGVSKITGAFAILSALIMLSSSICPWPKLA